MDSFSDTIWHAAGAPADFISRTLHDVDPPYVCAICGAETPRAADLDDTFGDNEDGWHHFYDTTSPWVCPGCVFVSKGRWKDQLRLWSVLWREDGACLDHHPSVYESIDEASYPVRLEPIVKRADSRVQITNRGRLDGILDTLLDPPDTRWALALTTSGKKKIHRFTPITAGDPYRVRLDMTTIQTSSIEVATALYHAAAMKACGVSSERVRSGRLDATYDRQHARRVQWHSTQLDAVRGHPVLELALFCLTQETTDDAGRRARQILKRRRPARLWRAAAAGDADERGHRRDRAQRLVAARASRTEGGGGHERELRPDGVQDGRQAPDRGAPEGERPGGQQDLFGD